MSEFKALQDSYAPGCLSAGCGVNIRDLVALDAAADARTYQAVLLERINTQIRVLSRAPYGVLPIYIWLLASGLCTA